MAKSKRLNYTKICRHALKIMLSIKDGIHNVEHIVRVYDWSMELAKNYPKTNLDVLKVSSYWHDVGRKYESRKKDDHNEKSAGMVDRYLRSQGASSEFISKVKYAVVNHSFKYQPTKIEAQILHDADKLAFLAEHTTLDGYLSMNEGYETRTFKKDNLKAALRKYLEDENILLNGLMLPESKEYYKLKKEEFLNSVEKVVKDKL